VGTVTAQLLYEIAGPRYLSPDAVARFDSMVVEQEGPDRVRISQVKGEPPPPTLKVTANLEAGWRNSMTLAITGALVEEKARLASSTVWAGIPGGRDSFAETSEVLSGDLSGGGMAFLRLAVRGYDQRGGPGVLGGRGRDEPVQLPRNVLHVGSGHRARRGPLLAHHHCGLSRDAAHRMRW
jgi:hypothetical protein